MTSLITPKTPPDTSIIYPSRDGEPVAETYDHLYALLTTLEVLKNYLAGQRATVLADQFLYYSQGVPKSRIAPDVMVIFDVEPGGRDNYKTWEEGQVPKAIFEMTSESTRDRDRVFKKDLYEQLGVEEYWLFDPKGEWIEGQLEGYRLVGGTYQPITNSLSQALKLRLVPEGKLIGFYRQDTGEKLLTSAERAEQERQRAEQERQRAEELQALLERYQEQFGNLE
ncbi:Uma2 family endonuclease [Roseofilum sp. BLCC_M91]|uniref:Uma2 family endonuclease n=1 Tax=Roseofilum halophilum BLCC-M91 TaxID=3022259 RepID=A0ABT7BKP0_9CYAN|nr:Uma2 family endonuclease [Roseofilum halophilum]MDJ1179762.1 Uma2 family endonuclease [Roseofilum halophilum BLCC-M91]